MKPMTKAPKCEHLGGTLTGDPAALDKDTRSNLNLNLML